MADVAGRSVALWKAGLLALAAAVVSNYAVYVGAMALFDIPAEFPPLAGPGPLVFFTVISSVAAVGVFAGIAQVSSRPVAVFRVIAGVVLLVSFMPRSLVADRVGLRRVPGRDRRRRRRPDVYARGGRSNDRVVFGAHAVVF